MATLWLWFLHRRKSWLYRATYGLGSHSRDLMKCHLPGTAPVLIGFICCMSIGPFSPRICGHLANNACLDTCAINTFVSPAGWGVERPWVLGLPLLRTFVWSGTTFPDFSYFGSIISVWPQESYEDEIVPQWKHILKSRNKLTTPRMAVLHLDTYVQVQIQCYTE